MSLKSFLVHYKNKYPAGSVSLRGDALDVHDADGVHRVSLIMGGNGQIIDQGASVGAVDSHDLCPIPKNARAFKMYADGSVKLAEEGHERSKAAQAMAVDGKVLSIEEYKKQGATFDDKGNLVSK